MPDALAITGVIQSFNAITNIAKALLGMHEAAAIDAKVIELNREILSLHQAAFAAVMEQSALLEQKRELEKKVADLETWETEKQKYRLANIRDQATTNHFGRLLCACLRRILALPNRCIAYVPTAMRIARNRSFRKKAEEAQSGFCFVRDAGWRLAAQNHRQIGRR